MRRVLQEVLTAPYRDTELLVRFRAGVSEQVKDMILLAHSARRKRQLAGGSSVDKLELPAGRDVRTAALQLILNPQVEFAEPNFLISKQELRPNDPQVDVQWALRNTGQNGGQYGSDINVAPAWQTITGSAATIVAVIDSGVDFTHPDLTKNRWTNPHPLDNGDLHGWDFITDSGEIRDEHGHGTAVAGIIAAEGNNSLGITGVMWRAGLMSLRVLDNTATGDIADAVEAIDYAVAHGAQVINLSWGTYGESVALRDAIERAIRRNVVVVCSAGNSSRNLDASPYYPASFNLTSLISVAATDNSDQLAVWSNWGARSVTLGAPGTNILTTQRGGGYWNVTGTSAAAPMVAGIAGLLKTMRPHGSVAGIARAIATSVRQTRSLAGKVSSGGVADAGGALAALRGSIDSSLPFQTPGFGSGGTGQGGSFSTTPPAMTTGAPGANLPNLDEARRTQSQQPKSQAPIQSNLPCADCDPQGGGGGGSYFPINDPNFSTARGRPVNETGEAGVDPNSRNFNWGLPLLSLAGRAGLDLNLTLSYNSLVWTKDGSYMKFNADLGSPAPGFRLGFPTLQQRFLNSQTGMWAYIMVTPSGGRVELRQVGTSNIYESEDGSYTQLNITDVNAPAIRTTDGTQYTFTPAGVNNEYRCREIKDRNGNYISATYNSTNGHLQTITDTLGRVVEFLYDTGGNLQAIRQSWGGVWHNWATFNYGQVWVAPGFGGGLLVNGPNNNYTTVLTQVSLQDGTYFTFDYNAAFAQVNRINSYAADGHLRSYTSYNVSASAGQTECPRFTEQRHWVDNWNSGNEALTSYSVAADGSWTQVTMPDSTTVYKELVFTSGWQTGLTSGTEIRSGGVLKKWTTIAWTQDDTNLSYQKNPRPIDTSIYDEAGNRRRVETIYTSYNLPNPVALPTEVKEFAADGATVLRRTTTTYFDGGQAYIDRRVLGLRREVIVYDTNNQPQSKVWYDYDWGNDYWAATPQPATQHDASGVATGRGNLCWIGRWDVSDINNFDKHTRSFIKYNRTGSVIRSEDHYGIGNTVSYTDSFSDAVNRNTFAYPTSVTDADGFTSNAQYNVDLGAVTKTIVPGKGTGLAGDPIQYLEHRMNYDSAGRIDRVMNQNNGAYTRYVYLPYGSVQSFTQDQTGVERYNIVEFDGAGRVRASGMNHSNSTGGYSVQYMKYDIMGRLSEQSNPTEVNSSWVPAGDDSAWLWTLQSYDWKGRPLQTTNPDATTRDNTYAGCGCAGGETVTIRDERGRRRMLTMDVFGRLKQVDELNWDQSVYATTTYTYNARDQITHSSQAGQVRTFEYDGFGRLWKRTTPEQGLTTFTYNANDTVSEVKDARNVIQTFSYNNRRLLTGITYNVSGDPTGQTAATPNVSFGYNAAGNRTQMTDGLGTVTYGYNSLAQLTSETRSFTGVGSFILSYSYDRGGQLLSLTNSVNGSQISYGYDHSTRVSAVTGSGYGGVSTYAGNIRYRSWSGLKSVSYGNSRALSVSYDYRLRPTQWNIPGVMGWNYAYDNFNENTGRVTYAQNLNDSTLDRSYDYDHVGRLIEARTASEARGHLNGQGGTQDGPYAHSYRYDQMGNMWYRVGWGGWFNAWLEQWPSYTNNRLTTNPWSSASMTYDAAGNLTNDGYQSYSYDATGQQTYASGTTLTHSYDGDRLRAKKVESGATTYYLRSSVLGGQVISELNASGGLQRGYVYLGSEMLAIQQSNQVSWVHQDPVTKSQRVTNSGGTVTSTIDLDPWGGETSRSSNQAFQPHRYTTYGRDANGGDEAMMRRYAGKWHRFVQPDPYDGSYDLTNPQSFNRYAYVQNDPVNFVDPLGLDPEGGVLGALLGPVANMGPGTSTVTIYMDGDSDLILGADTHAQLVYLQDSGLTPQGGPQDSGQPFLTTALDEARRRLRENADCAKLFGGEKNALKKLSELKFKFGSLPDRGIARIKGKNVTLDSARFAAQGSNLAFVTNIRESTVQGYPSTSFTLRNLVITGSTFGAFVLLHELGHRTKIYGKYDNDGGSQYDNLPTGANNEKIRAACFGELEPY
ncbi:MAG TPA: S8 family serine peptidase [Pyrinomonadaceae bacterium]|nr:S8 family serine peptidase [Pyrinomonadaceae bacterium]